VSYYNEFKPRKQELVVDTSKAVSEDGTPIARNFYDEKIGWYTNGYYAVKTEKPKNINIHPGTQPDVSRIIPKNANIKAEFVGEFHYGEADKDREAPKIHLIAENGYELVFDAAYIDAVLTEHPDAKPFIEDTERKLIPAVFKVKGKSVAVVMPVKMMDESTRYSGTE